MLVLGSREIEALFAPAELVTAICKSLSLVDRSIVPKRAHLEGGNTLLLAMPALAPDIWGTKLVTVTTANAAIGLPTIQGVMVLGDTATGRPKALIDAAALTAQRTGAVGSLGLSQIAPKDTATIGIIGTGVQAVWQAVFAASVRPIDTVFCLTRSEAAFERFRAQVLRLAPALQIEACANPQSLLASTDVIVAATSSATPVLPDDETLLVGKTLISVGSFRPDMQELPNAAYRLAAAIMIDSPDAETEVGDVANALANGFVARSALIGLGDAETPSGRTRIFKSVGWAGYDLFAANFFYEQALKRGIGTEIDL